MDYEKEAAERVKEQIVKAYMSEGMTRRQAEEKESRNFQLAIRKLFS